MLAPLSMIATVTAFSLFTAYQFLSSDMCIDTPESKMRPFPSWMYQWVCVCMMEMIATSFFLLTAYQILSAKFIENSTWQRCDSKLQYNTCRVRTRQFSALGCLVIPDHMFIISRYEVDHMCWLECSSLLYLFLLSVLLLFFSASEAIFERFYHPKSVTTYQSFGSRIWPHLWP